MLSIQRTLTSKIFTVRWALFRSLRDEGIGAEVKHASLISKKEENLLLENGVLGIDNPLQLLRAVFYVNGKVFCLHGGKEHRNLKIPQFIRHFEPDHYVYTENGLKNRREKKSGYYCKSCVMVHGRWTYFIVNHLLVSLKIQLNLGIQICPLERTNLALWSRRCLQRLAYTARLITVCGLPVLLLFIPRMCLRR